MAEFAALPLFTDSWIADTAHLTRLERGLYCDLLVLMWRSPECRVPNDLDWISRRLRCDESERRTLELIVAEFCQSTGNWITQKRLAKEFSYVREKSKKQSDRAKSRWDKDKDECHGNAEPHASGNAASMPIAGAPRGPGAGARDEIPTAHDKSLVNNNLGSSRGNAPTPTPSPTPSKEKSSPLEPPLDALPLGLPPHPPDEGLKAASGRKGGASRGSRLPSDWRLSDEGRAYATAKGLSAGRIEREAERFRDFWLAKTGKDAVKADWEATWRNWVLRVVDRGDLTLGTVAPAAPVVRYFDN